MVQRVREQPVRVLRVFDRNGQPIGEVVQPRTDTIVGRGARTVLLVRGEKEERVQLAGA
jgi:hypothetical protein